MADSMLRQFERIVPSDAQKKLAEETREKFITLARWIEARIPVGAQRELALQRLLEGKDAAVRAVIFEQSSPF